jgi:hypothetical protein
MDKHLGSTLRPMGSNPHPSLINTQLQLGAGRPEETANRFNGLCVAPASPSAAERHREIHLAATRRPGQTVETVFRPLRAVLTQLKLGVNERGERTVVGICDLAAFTNSRHLL